MTPQAVLANDYFTSASAATTASCSAEVIYLGAFSTRPAEGFVGAPEESIDYEAGAAALLAASDVEEPTSSPVSVDSRFGI